MYKSKGDQDDQSDKDDQAGVLENNISNTFGCIRYELLVGQQYA